MPDNHCGPMADRLEKLNDGANAVGKSLERLSEGYMHFESTPFLRKEFMDACTAKQVPFEAPAQEYKSPTAEEQRQYDERMKKLEDSVNKIGPLLNRIPGT